MPILSNNNQKVQVEFRNETGKLIFFIGTGKIIVSVKFWKFFEMEAYYSNQASQSKPHFSGHYRQRGSGFGALAAGIGRVALPLARKFLWPAIKKIACDILVQGAPELVEVATRRKLAKEALKNTVAKTARKQIGGSVQLRIATGRKMIRRKRQQYKTPRSNRKQKIWTRRIIFFESLLSSKKMRTNIVIPSEATHSSLNLFEKPPLLVTFDQSF